MQQPIDLQKIRILARYHETLRGKFYSGRLAYKLKLMLKTEAKRIGISLSTYYRWQKRHPLSK